MIRVQKQVTKIGTRFIAMIDLHNNGRIVLKNSERSLFRGPYAAIADATKRLYDYVYVHEDEPEYVK